MPSTLRLAATRVCAVLLAGIAAWPAFAAIGDEPAGAQTIVQGRFVATDATTVPAVDAGTPVALPDEWALRRPGVTGSAWYVFEWVVPPEGAGVNAVYLTATTLPTEVYVNAQLIGATGALLGPPPRTWQQSRLFVVPAGIALPGQNQIALRVHERTPGAGGMGPLLVGAEPVLRDRALRDLFLHTFGPGVVGVTIVVLGIFIGVLWLRRRNPVYGLFSATAIVFGIHTGMSLTATPPLPPPHWGVWWNSLYMLFVGLMCLFCLRFAEADWRIFRRVIVAFVVAVPIVLYAAVAAGVGGAAATIARLFGILIVLVTLTQVARYALRRRGTESVLLLFAGATAAGFGLHDWLAAQAGTDMRPLMLVPYAGLAFLLLVGWILVNRFVGALNEFEVLNATLEQRVAEKSAALVDQLKETRAARDAAEAANRAKTRFLAAASHDLRQPLHALGLFAARLSDRTRDAEDAALVQRIATSVTSLESLFSALLDVSKLDAGVVTATTKAVALDALFDRLAYDFSPEALERGLKLSVLPARYVVSSDPVLLERILRNLITNALRYTTRGGIVVGARKRGERVAIEVWDSGPGIAPDDIERVFEEFYQVGNPERDRAKGLGLGLAIVRRLSQLLGHEVQVASRPGRGTVFRVLVDPASAGAEPVRAPALPRALDPLPGRRVLVIDDEESVREATRQTLAAWGCIPIVAADAEEGVAACAGQPCPDAMVVDYRLREGRNGVDAIGLLRAALAEDVPAMVISGESSVEELLRIQAGGYLLLHKPVTPAKLRAALTHLLAQDPVAA